MIKDELIHMRNMLKGQLIRTCQLSLSLHKEQEHIEDLIRIVDAQILKQEEV